MAPCHDTHQSRTYRNILHAAIIIISRRFFYFFYFSLLLHRKVREKRGSIKARLLVGPSWGRWARKKERERVWLDETCNSPRRIGGIGDGRQSRRVASRFEEGKTCTQSFSIASSRQRKAHPCDYHNIVRSWLDRQAFRFFVPKKKKKMTANSGEDMTALALRKDITRTSTCTTQLSSGWPIFNTPTKKRSDNFKKKKKKREKEITNNLGVLRSLLLLIFYHYVAQSQHQQTFAPVVCSQERERERERTCTNDLISFGLENRGPPCKNKKEEKSHWCFLLLLLLLEDEREMKNRKREQEQEQQAT